MHLIIVDDSSIISFESCCLFSQWPNIFRIFAKKKQSEAKDLSRLSLPFENDWTTYHGELVSATEQQAHGMLR